MPGIFDDLDDVESMFNRAAEIKRTEEAKQMVPVVTQTGSPHEQMQQQYLVRRRWLASMWLLGASTNKLADIEKVKQPTVIKLLDKELPRGTRGAMRLSQELSFEALRWYTERYQENVGAGLYHKPPLQIAQWLSQSHPYQPGE